eukprot:TRINITY_DN1895_c0_g1_i2.p1 TRINITY_DN1895_c0_g1~~TRINITY_DN1895_c0_g1_i2.p1  ORF type:complete len:153 (-),score=41.54 TRINITY_DN1895_c0_g1_i2:93-551(-)
MASQFGLSSIMIIIFAILSYILASVHLWDDSPAPSPSPASQTTSSSSSSPTSSSSVNTSSATEPSKPSLAELIGDRDKIGLSSFAFAFVFVVAFFSVFSFIAYRILKNIEANPPKGTLTPFVQRASQSSIELSSKSLEIPHHSMEISSKDRK